ncbi:MAG: hypothetical protein QOI59_5118 [Gammaproteobacteria bacterium]|nr:hypothetical protein [Gammaproteobacteria bacterium]
MRLWTELQVRFHVPVQARSDLFAGLQVRCLKTLAYHPGRAGSGPYDSQAELGANQAPATRVDIMLPAFDATPPAHVLDQALAGIATRYGRTTADDVASAFEYPGFHK